MDCRSNEMGYMFYYNLGGTFTVNETGNQSILNNIQDVYWYSRMRPPLGLSISAGALLLPKQGELVCLVGCTRGRCHRCPRTLHDRTFRSLARRTRIHSPQESVICNSRTDPASAEFFQGASHAPAPHPAAPTNPAYRDNALFRPFF